MFRLQHLGSPDLPSLTNSLADFSSSSGPSIPSSTRADAPGSESPRQPLESSANTDLSLDAASHPRISSNLSARVRALIKFGSTTVRMGHQPYEQFKDHVETLWKSLSPLQLWNKAPKRSSFFDGSVGRYLCSSKLLRPFLRRWNPGPPECEVERLRGGSFNRVIGLSIPETYQKSSDIERRFILRVPRDDFARLDREVATLEYLRDQSSIPVPEAVHADHTCQNPIEAPYMIQKRIPGRPLCQIWDDLNVEQRCSVARDLGGTLCKIRSLTHPAPGIIDSYETVANGLRKALVASYDLVGHDEIIEEPEPETICTTKGVSLIDFFLSQINRWRKWDLKLPQRIGNAVYCWDRVIRATEEMDVMGLLKDNTYSLCHLDLATRNMMAEIQDNDTVKITGYLDWDSAVFAPSFVGCAPPYWMWFEHNGEDYDEELERGANIMPSDPENQKIKQAFEDAVDRDYLHFAYQPQYRLARMLFRVAKDGIWDRRRAGDAVKFVEEWSELRNLLLPEPAVKRWHALERI